MVWVFGNSYERVPIKDLNDVIYFRQKKQYSDQEFEGSKDLQREIQKGRIIKLEHLPEVKGSLPENLGISISNSSRSDITEIRRVITEVMLGQQKSEGVDFKDLAVNLIPVIAETVRQEVLRIQVSAMGQTKINSELQIEDLKYVPKVEVADFKSNIKIEGQAIEGQDVSDSLKMLKRLQK
jgi:hypothetical protein